MDYFDFAVKNIRNQAETVQILSLTRRVRKLTQELEDKKRIILDLEETIDALNRETRALTEKVNDVHQPGWVLAAEGAKNEK